MFPGNLDSLESEAWLCRVCCSARARDLAVPCARATRPLVHTKQSSRTRLLWPWSFISSLCDVRHLSLARVIFLARVLSRIIFINLCLGVICRRYFRKAHGMRDRIYKASIAKIYLSPEIDYLEGFLRSSGAEICEG